jgi:hypothetical protein
VKLFGQIVRTVVNTALLPVAIAKDIVTLGGSFTESGRSSTLDALERLKEEAREDDDE